MALNSTTPKQYVESIVLPEKDTDEQRIPERLDILNLLTFGAPWWLMLASNWCFHLWYFKWIVSHLTFVMLNIQISPRTLFWWDNSLMIQHTDWWDSSRVSAVNLSLSSSIIRSISDTLMSLNIDINTCWWLSERWRSEVKHTYIYNRYQSTLLTVNPISPSSIKGIFKNNPCSLSLFCLSVEKKCVFSTIRTNVPPPVIDAVKLDVCGTLALANEHINWWPAVSNYYTLVN